MHEMSEIQRLVQAQNSLELIDRKLRWLDTLTGAIHMVPAGNHPREFGVTMETAAVRQVVWLERCNVEAYLESKGYRVPEYEEKTK